MKTFKEFISEEGYDIARDQGRVRPSKDKKDATSYPPSAEGPLYTFRVFSISGLGGMVVASFLSLDGLILP